jgi:hypothetical protein
VPVTAAGGGAQAPPPAADQNLTDQNLDIVTRKSPDDSRQRLMILTAEPGTPSHERLRILASWNAEPHPGPGAERLPVKATDA